jgi:hypothetical protein
VESLHARQLRIRFFYLQFSKTEIFQKILSRFLVLNSNEVSLKIEERFGKYSKMAAQSKMAGFRLFILKKLPKIYVKVFFHSLNGFVLGNIHILWQK